MYIIVFIVTPHIIIKDNTNNKYQYIYIGMTPILMNVLSSIWFNFADMVTEKNYELCYIQVIQYLLYIFVHNEVIKRRLDQIVE